MRTLLVREQLVSGHVLCARSGGGGRWPSEVQAGEWAVAIHHGVRVMDLILDVFLL